MLECCFTMSVLTALLSGFIIGMITKKLLEKTHISSEDKFAPSAPVLASRA